MAPAINGATDRMTYALPIYRPDIDGLRAIAIVSVLLFHAVPKAVPGGYVGVDVFFVISGFLITLNIVQNLQHDSFSFAEFYIRRAKRIFAPLAVVLFTTMAMGWLWLMPSEFANLGKHGVAGAFFATNVTQWTEAGYFGAAAQLKPLLHLWSLGIEEQFYLAWPLVAFVAWKLGRQTFFIAAVILAASLIWNLYQTPLDPIAAFYLPFTRAWELMLGACLAAAPARAQLLSPMSRALASPLGLILIVASVISYNPLSQFPGWRAMLPTAGAALLLWAGPTAFINRWMLSNPLAVAIGLISYSLYLWHWPLLSFLAIAHLDTTANNGFALAIAVLLSVATYFAVERPVRRGPLFIWPIPTIAIGVAALVGYAIFVGNIRPLDAGPELARVESAAKDWYPPMGEYIPFEGQWAIRYGKGPRAVLMIGDSNLQQYFPRVHDIVDHDPTLSTVWIAWGGCAPIIGVDDLQPGCHHFYDAVYQYAAASPAKKVVIAGQWFGYFNYPGFSYGGHPTNTPPGYNEALASLERSMSDLVKGGKIVYLILPMPVGNEFGPEFLGQAHSLRTSDRTDRKSRAKSAAASIRYLGRGHATRCQESRRDSDRSFRQPLRCRCLRYRGERRPYLYECGSPEGGFCAGACPLLGSHFLGGQRATFDRRQGSWRSPQAPP